MATKRKMMSNDAMEEMSAEKRKGRKKGFVWSHVIQDEEGKVSCMHCGEPIKINFGEKVKIKAFYMDYYLFLLLLFTNYKG